MAKIRHLEDSNRSANPSIHEVSDPARRKCAVGWCGGGRLYAPLVVGCAATATVWAKPWSGSRRAARP
jgi:hypothetical protein